MSTEQIAETSAVLTWLSQNHPELHAVAELDREWTWLPVDLRGDENKPVRESIKAFGFRFANHGHPLPSGKVGTWAHHGVKPTPFHRSASRKSRPSDRTASPVPVRLSDDELLRVLGDNPQL